MRRDKPEHWGRWNDRSDKLVLHSPVMQKRITRAFVNNVFSVQMGEETCQWGAVTHLWIRRHDGQPPIWREMQRIKDELVGPLRTAVEVFPNTYELVDVAPMYHLWVLPEAVALPFGLHVLPPEVTRA